MTRFDFDVDRSYQYLSMHANKDQKM